MAAVTNQGSFATWAQAREEFQKNPRPDMPHLNSVLFDASTSPVYGTVYVIIKGIVVVAILWLRFARYGFHFNSIPLISATIGLAGLSVSVLVNGTILAAMIYKKNSEKIKQDELTKEKKYLKRILQKDLEYVSKKKASYEGEANKSSEFAKKLQDTLTKV